MTPTGTLLLTVNLDGPQFWLRVDPSAGDRPKTLSIGEYGLRRGLPRLLKVLADRQVKATWFVPGVIAECWPEEVGAIAAVGHEIAGRSQDLTPLGGLDAEDQYRRIDAGAAAVAAVTGCRPPGFRAPPGEVDAATYAALTRAGFVWSSSLHGADTALTIRADGAPVGEIPIPPEQSDSAHFEFNYAPAYPAGHSRIKSYDLVLEEWCGNYESCAAEGVPYVLSLTPHVIGKPGRARLLARFLDTVLESGAVPRTVSEWLAARPAVGL